MSWIISEFFFSPRAIGHYILLNIIASCINNYCSMLFIRHQYMAQCCALWLDAVHLRLNDVYQASVWFNAVYQASIWLNAVYQASLWHNMAQCCASCITIWLKPVHHVSICGASMTQAVHHACINTKWLITLNLPHHTLSTFSVFLPHHTLSTSFFTTCLCMVNTWRRKKIKESGCWPCRAALENDR